MKKSKYLIVTIMFTMVFALIQSVKAESTSFPSSFTLSRESSPITIGDVNMYYKSTTLNSKNYLIFCLGKSEASTTNGATYAKKTNTVKESQGYQNAKYGAGVAYIIMNGVGSGKTTADVPSTSAGTNGKYLATQAAIWKYMNDAGEGYSNSDVIASLESLTCGDKNCKLFAQSLVAGAKEYAELYKTYLSEKSDSQIYYTVNQNELSFKKDETGENYISAEPLKISNADGLLLNDSVTLKEVSDQTNIEGVTITGNNTDGFVITIPTSSVTSTNNKVTVKFGANLKFGYAPLFVDNAGADNHQHLALTLLYERTPHAEKTMSYVFEQEEEVEEVPVEDTGRGLYLPLAVAGGVLLISGMSLVVYPLIKNKRINLEK